MAARKRFLTKAKVLAAFHAEGSLQDIGLALDMSPAHVGDIKRGVYHRDVTGAEFRPSSRNVVTASMRKAIEEHPGTYERIARDVKVCPCTVKKYKRLYRLRTGQKAAPQPRDGRNRFAAKEGAHANG